MEAELQMVRIFPVSREGSPCVPGPVLAKNATPVIHPSIGAKGPSFHLSTIDNLKFLDSPLSTDDILRITVRECMTPKIAMPTANDK